MKIGKEPVMFPYVIVTVSYKLWYLRWIRMAQRIPDEVLMNTELVKHLADVAKDAALLQGVLMRIQETPNSSEVSGPLHTTHETD